MNIYKQKQRWKFFLFAGAILIGVGSLVYTNKLVKALSAQERTKIQLWAEAMRVLDRAEPDKSDLGFPLSVIENNTTVPVILTDSAGDIITYRNIDSLKATRPGYLGTVVQKMKEEHDSIVINLMNGDKNFIYYRDSILLTRLFYFPFIQLGVIVLFILVSYFAFSSSRKAEQNKVWVGLSKETAHQLGTPTSSLFAWVELLKGGNFTQETITELEKDVKRLEKITERFSKIGSRPSLTRINIEKVLENSMTYLKSRSPGKIKFMLDMPDHEVLVPLNESLFEWVIENVCKNAIDAMSGSGHILLSVKEYPRFVHLDISDTGKGIPKSKFKTIFKPGYTTKQRGWGLGLSLTRRIVEYYHNGKIYVQNSELNSGTTFRIVLKK